MSISQHLPVLPAPIGNAAAMGARHGATIGISCAFVAGIGMEVTLW
jgi:hypothetical protein